MGQISWKGIPYFKGRNNLKTILNYIFNYLFTFSGKSGTVLIRLRTS
jgi:hypothetical protein